MSAGAIGVAAAATGPPADNHFAEIRTADFIKVLVTELANQNPFDPQDSAALLEQLSSLRNIESQLALQDKLESLVLQNQVTASSNLIGRFVSGLDANNDVVDGVVISVKIQNGAAVLELDSGAMLPIDRVTRIESVAGQVDGND